VIMLPSCKSTKYTRDGENELQKETHAANTSDVSADGSCEDSDDGAADDTVDETEDDTVDEAADDTVDEAADDTVDEAADDTVDETADDTVSTDKKFINPPCLCGNQDNFTKYGNFFISCRGCNIFTCLICMRSIKSKRHIKYHLGRHLLMKNSPITKSHIDRNNTLAKHKCNNVKCGKTGSCQNNHVGVPTTALCKICNYAQCVKKDCNAAFRNRLDLVIHRSKEHRYDMKSKEGRFSRPGKPDDDKSNKITRIGNFGGMCESMAHILCLLCGQEQRCQNTLSVHLLAHNVKVDAPTTEKHTAQNLNMFNYTCLHCDRKGSVKTTSARKKKTLQCRFCDTFQCLDSLCQKTYSSYHAFRSHCNKTYSGLA